MEERRESSRQKKKLFRTILKSEYHNILDLGKFYEGFEINFFFFSLISIHKRTTTIRFFYQFTKFVIHAMYILCIT